ncbi:hypothetical protein GETHLI_22220 [Geothrix limicola]|uniref:Uncharacterized protein n=1 Tax=Geothrix limicola TaxID=2927978 RepID=A0ABQ5QFV5_9BACT|nr:hypothetical protein [Geothrix limicola]GLH73720.1 hypothetical protein GETHLI_22220 [Geothrix limicola]
MDTSPTWLDHLKLLAAAESVPPEAISREALDHLVAQGLILKDERPKQASLESRYAALQETHRQIVEAKGCVDRLQRRLAPKSRLAGLFPIGAPAGPKADDPDAVQLLSHLEVLRLQIRGVSASGDVVPHLDRILDYLVVEGRDCLDRLADTDREIDQAQKEILPGTQVEGLGYFRLTPAGEAALPEAPVMALLEGALQAAFGTGARGPSFPHFKEDPSALLTLLMSRMAAGDRPSSVVGEYEDLLTAFDRIPAFADLQPLRAKIGVLVRLLRAFREDPKKAYLWCNRDRLAAAAQRMRALLPPTVAASGWHLPYTADVFLVDGGVSGDETQAEHRIRLFEAVQRIQTEVLAEARVRDGQSFRLALVLAHAARVRNFSPGILMDRFVRQALDTVLEAARCAPYDLGDRGTTLLFGTHLAHAAGYSKTRLQGPLDAFAAIHARFRDEPASSRLSVQVLLHIFATLDRLERLGAPLPLEAYAGLFDRVRKHLHHHKAASRAFGTAQIKAGDEAALVSNLCAQVCFHGLALPEKNSYHPDAGLAGLYEDRIPGRPPLLGSPFGTLLLI